MVGLKVAEGNNKVVVSPSSSKKNKKMKLKGKDLPQVGKVVNSPLKSTNGTGILKEPSKPEKSSDGTTKKKDKKKSFGKFAKRNALKAKDDVFTQMVKKEAVKENLSPSFLKKLDKCIARLPEAGKRFVQWLVHDVNYKIKFLPVIEEVFKLIKDMKVLPLPSSGKPPKTQREKKRERQQKRKALKAAGTLGNSAPKKPEDNVALLKSEEKQNDESNTETPKQSNKRKMSDVSFMDIATLESGKKKQKTKPLVTKAEKSPDSKLADVSLNVSETNTSTSEKKKKKKKSFGKVSSD